MIISFIIAIVLATLLHGGTRRFVRDRLRYVDSVQKGFVPLAAGGAAFLVAIVLPYIGIGIAATAGLAVGSGVIAGVRDIRSGVSTLISNR